jgi:hypothetical protein
MFKKLAGNGSFVLVSPLLLNNSMGKQAKSARFFALLAGLGDAWVNHPLIRPKSQLTGGIHS